MKKISNLLAALWLAGAMALPVAAVALPAVQRTGLTGEATPLPAVQSGWFMALLMQLQTLLGA
jgi:hypothetical protein